MAKSRGNNPIGYADLFDFNDPVIQQAMREIKELFDVWREFKREVTNPIKLGIDAQSKDLADTINAVAVASEKLNVTQEKSQQVLMKNLETIQKLKDENDALKASKKGVKDTEKALEDSVNGLNAKLKEQLTLYNKMSRDNDPMKLKTLAAEIQVTRHEITELNNATKGTTSVFQAAKGSYAALDAETKRLVKDLQQMDNGMDANNQSAVALQKQIFQNTARLKAFDAQINQNFRNVGNYKSAFDGFGNSVQQILRETPAAAVSMQTFFLAISNNLPQFFDEVEKMKKAQEAATVAAKEASIIAKEQAIAEAMMAGATAEAAAAKGAEAEATVMANAAMSAQPGLMKRLLSSIFSLQSGLTLVVLLLTLFGSELFASVGHAAKAVTGLNKLTKSQQSLKDAAELAKIAQENLNKALEGSEYTEAVKNVEELRINVDLAKQGLLDKKKVVEQYNKTMGEAAGQVKTLDEVEKQLADNSEHYIQMMLYKAAANISLQEAAKKAADAETNRMKKLDEFANAAIDTRVSTGGTFGFGTGQFDPKEYDRETARIKAAQAKRQKEILDADNKAKEQQLTIAKNLQTRAAEEAKKMGGNLYGTNSKDTKAEETAAEKAKRLREKAEREAEQAERKLQQAIKKQEDLIEASAKLQIAQAELTFAQSAQTAADEINLENQKSKILGESFTSRLKLYAKGTKEYINILTERAKTESETENKITAIKNRSIEEDTKNKISAATADFERTEKGWTDELYFEDQKLKILTASFDARLSLYKKDSDEYKAILQAKTDAEAVNAAKQIAIRQQQDKAKTGAADADRDVTETRYRAGVKVSVAKGKITKEAGEDQIHKGNVDAINDQIRAKELQLSKAKEGDADYYNYLKELSGLQKQLIDENSSYEISKAEQVKEKKKELQQAIFDFTTETAGQLFSLGKDLNAANIDDLQHQKDKELEIAGNNSAAKQKIEEDYNRQILAKKRKQAVYDKLEALFNIGINTAIAVSKAVAASPLTFGMPFSAFAIAEGAIRAATVLARPLPKYYKGREGGKKEWAEVNEEGTELLEKNGRFRIAAGGKKGFTLLDEGEKVHTASKTKNIFRRFKEQQDSDNFIDSLLEGTNVVRDNQQIKDNNLVGAILSSKLSEETMFLFIEKAFSKLPHDVLEANEAGIRRFTKSKNGKTEHLNSRNTMTGNG